MADLFDDYQSGLESPATRLLAVTPDDATDLAHVSRALNVAQAGTIRITTIHGDTGTISVAAGMPFPVRVSRVWQTGTTATGIVALF